MTVNIEIWSALLFWVWRIVSNALKKNSVVTGTVCGETTSNFDSFDFILNGNVMCSKSWSGRQD